MQYQKALARTRVLKKYEQRQAYPAVFLGESGVSESRNDKEIFENAYVFYVSDSDKLGKRMGATTIQLQPQKKVVGPPKLDNVSTYSL